MNKYVKYKNEQRKNSDLTQKAESAKNKASIFNYKQRWFTHPLITALVGLLIGYLLGRL